MVLGLVGRAPELLVSYRSLASFDCEALERSA